MKEYDVFLSYHSSDGAAAQNIASKLTDSAKLVPFLDKWCLVPGEPWQEAIERAIESSASCAVLVGPNGLGPWQHEEMSAALERRVSSPAFHVIPVTLPNSDPAVKNKLPPFIRRLTWVDMNKGIDDEDAFSSLVAGISGNAPGRSRMVPSDGRTSWEYYDWLLQIDEYQIAYIPLINSSLDEPLLLSINDIKTSSESVRFTLPKDLAATKIGARFDNDRSCRLSSYRYTTEKRLVVKFSETSYEDYLKSGEHLDDPHPNNPDITLRDKYGGLIRDGESNLRPFRLTNIAGVGVFVLSNDGFVLAAQHSEQSHVYPGRLTFTASGTLKWTELPDPFSQIVRKSWEEVHHQIVIDRLRLIGFGADARKLFFQFSFVEEHPASVDKILEHMASQDNLRLIPIELDAITEVLVDECWEPAAEATLLTLLSQRFSKEEVVSSLRRCRPKWSHRNMRDEWDYRASRPGLLPDMSVRYPPRSLSSGSRRYIDNVVGFLRPDLDQSCTKVVEVGGGTGRVTKKLVELVHALTVVDLSKRMINRNRKRLHKKESDVQYIEGFAQECLVDKKYDIAIAFLVFVHNVDKNDFRGLIESMCKAAPMVFICEDVTTNRPTSPRTIIRTKKEIGDSFSRVGFELTKERKFRLFKDELWIARFERF